MILFISGFFIKTQYKIGKFLFITTTFIMQSNFYSLYSQLLKSVYTILLLVLLSSYNIFSQPDPVKWGKVSDEDAKLKLCSFDSSAAAVVLCDYGKVSFNYGSHVVIERHTRIKILDRKAIDKANVVLPYYVKDDLEKITNIKAQTINFSSQGKVTVQEVENSQIFDVKENDKWHQKRFTLPAVKEGSIIEYKYTTLSKNYTFLEAWMFQNDIPTIHSEFRAAIGQDLDYRIMYQGNRLLAEYGSKPANRWVLQNLPALVEEPYTANYMNYAEKIRFQLAGYYAASKTVSSGPEYVTTMNTWEKLSKELLDEVRFTSYMNRHGIASEIIEKLVLPADNDLARIQKIYNYVKNTVSWDGRLRIFTEKNLPSLMESKQGSSAEINLYLTLLLKEAGLDASPALVSTREHGFPQSSYPLLSQFNTLVTFVKAGEKELFLDAIDVARPYQLPDKADLNIAGFVLDKVKPRWVNIKAPTETRQIISVLADLKDIANPSYRMELIYKGYNAVDQRKKYAREGKDEFIKDHLSSSFDEYTVKEAKVTHAEEVDQDFSASFTIMSPDHINGGDKVIYLKPLLINNFQESPFKNTTRRLPVEFGYPSSYSYIMNLTIPDGYKVHEMPKPIVMKMPHDIGEFKYNIQVSGQQIQILTQVTIKSQFVPVEYYSHLQQFFDTIVEKYAQRIVLNKQ